MKWVFKKLLPFTIVLPLLACSMLGNVAKEVVKKPSVAFQSFSLGEMSMQAITLKPVFRVRNPNGFTIPVDAFNYTLTVNQKNMLDGMINNIGSLPANGYKDITVDLTISKDTLNAFISLFTRHDVIDYAVAGHAQVMGFRLPFNHSDRFTKPSVTIGDLKVEKANFNGVQLKAALLVDNKNTFSLPLDAIDYEVAAKGKSLFTGKVSKTTLNQGKNQVVLPLTFQPSQLFPSVLSIMQNPNVPLTFSLNTPFGKHNVTKSLNLSQLLGR